MNPESLDSLFNNETLLKEIWVYKENGNSMCALTNNNRGWLMHMRHEGDSGFSSRNPKTNSTTPIECRLENGQLDSFPENWFYPLETVKLAMHHFLITGDRYTEVTWHEE